MIKHRARREKGTGSLTLRKDGRYQLRIIGLDGKPKYAYTKTEREAKEQLRLLIRAVESGKNVHQKTPTTQDAILDWINSKAHVNKRQSQETNIGLAKPAIKAFGYVPVDRLLDSHITKFYRARLDDTWSAKTLKNFHLMLTAVMDRQVALGNVDRNIVHLVTPPKVQSRVIDCFTAVEMESIFQALDTTPNRISNLVKLAFATGMREGELFALRFTDCNFTTNVINVDKTLDRYRNTDGTKTNSSVRPVIVDARTMDIIRQQRAVLDAETINTCPLVFPTTIGTYRNTSGLLQREWYPLLDLAGVRKLRFHALRHTCATTLIALGVPVRVVASQLGHSDPAMTLRTYIHSSNEMSKEAATKMGEHMAKGLPGV